MVDLQKFDARRKADEFGGNDTTGPEDGYQPLRWQT